MRVVLNIDIEYVDYDLTELRVTAYPSWVIHDLHRTNSGLNIEVDLDEFYQSNPNQMTVPYTPGRKRNDLRKREYVDWCAALFRAQRIPAEKGAGE